MMWDSPQALLISVFGKRELIRSNGLVRFDVNAGVQPMDEAFSNGDNIPTNVQIQLVGAISSSTSICISTEKK